MKRLLLSAALLLAALINPAARAEDKAEKPKGDLGKLQGKWTGMFGPGKSIPLTLVVEGNDAKVHVETPNGGDVDVKVEIRIDDQAKPHKTIDWVNLTLPGGNALPDRLGIYKFEDDDTVKFCTAGLNNERPTAFGAEDGDIEVGRLTMVLKREGKEGKDAKADDLKGDLAGLQGDWTAKVGPGKNIPNTLAVKGQSFTSTYTLPSGVEGSTKGEIKLDEAAKPHKTIDWLKVTKPNGDEAPPIPGIYTLKGDKLTICSGGPGGERPTEFKQAERGWPNLIEYTRKAGDRP